MYPIMNTWLAEIHQEEMLQNAAKYRERTATRAGRPGIRARLSVRLGTLLIAAGQRIRAPYEPLLDQRPEIYGQGC